jgi:hypothetical protein
MPRKESDINGLFEDIATVLGIGASITTIVSFLLPQPQPQRINNYYYCNNPNQPYDFNRITIA